MDYGRVHLVEVPDPCLGHYAGKLGGHLSDSLSAIRSCPMAYHGVIF